MSGPHGATLEGEAVLVTGAAGLVGSALCAALLGAGAHVVALTRSDPGGSALALDGTAAGCRLVRADVRDTARVAGVLRDAGCSVAFHLAAQPLVESGGTAPRATFEANAAGTWSLLEACRDASVGRVVTASSDTVYGPGADAHDEDDALRAVRPYDASKAVADLVARSYGHGFGLAVAALRVTNVYGPGDRNLSRIVPSAITAALAGESPVVRARGASRRDLLHADDAAAAYLAVADLLAGGHGGGAAFNAASGDARTMLEVARLVCDLTGTGVAPVVVAAGVADERRSDASRLRAATGWVPRVGLEDGLRRTIAWYREHPECLEGA